MVGRYCMLEAEENRMEDSSRKVLSWFKDTATYYGVLYL